MRIARTISLGLGIMFLLGAGAVSLSRAQQTKEKAVTPGRVRSELRERVLTLRTEIDLLQLDFEADRTALGDLIKETSQPEQAELTMMQAMIMQFGLSGMAGAQDLSEKDLEKVKAKDELRNDIDGKRKDFAKKSRLLNEKRLELEDTEARYRAAPKS